MRHIYLTRGASGSGKSTWIKDNGLEPFTVSSDAVRLLYHGVEYGSDGTASIPQKYNKEVWQTVNQIIEERMKHGELIIVDAKFVRARDCADIRKLANQYRYRVSFIDFTDVDLDLCIERNASRPGYKRVPEHTIYRDYTTFRGKQESEFIAKHTLVRGDALDSMQFLKYFDYSEYDSIVVIGDVHGCYSALRDMFITNYGIDIDTDPLDEKTLYIFVGDYIDRGIENAQVMEKLLSWMNLPNVHFVEGNHERWLDFWSKNEIGKINSDQFLKHTMPELEEAGISKKEVRQFIRRLRQLDSFRFFRKHYFVCHGGISTTPLSGGFPFESISTEQLIKGTGSYESVTESDEEWSERWPSTVQIHGHRSDEEHTIHPQENVYSLEGGVENGGNLYSIRILPSGKIEEFKTPNRVYYVHPKDVNIENLSVSDAVKYLRKNDEIREKKFGDISSFNFTRKAFTKNLWDAQNIHARGLFIDTKNCEIVARSYDKFFNLGQIDPVEDTVAKFQYPVTAYQKENGFLGISSYDKNRDRLFTASKSTPEGPYADRFREILEPHSDKLLNFLKKYPGVSAIFEVLDSDFDPHIVKYDEPGIVLLSIVENTFKFSQWDYEGIVTAANEIRVPVKRKTAVFENASEFNKWFGAYDSWWPERYVDDYTEGYVIEDASGFMVKLKSPWYLYWKNFRKAMEDVIRRGKSWKVQTITGPNVSATYEYLKQYIYDLKDTGKDLSKVSILDFKEACKANGSLLESDLT